MQSDRWILDTLITVVGCNGLRDFTDLGKMKQKTIEQRLHKARDELSTVGMSSIYARWLQDQMLRIGGAERVGVVTTWSQFLAKHGCDVSVVVSVWSSCIENARYQDGHDGEAERLMNSMAAVREQLLECHPLHFKRASNREQEQGLQNGEIVDQNIPSLDQALPNDDNPMDIDTPLPLSSVVKVSYSPPRLHKHTTSSPHPRKKASSDLSGSLRFAKAVMEDPGLAANMARPKNNNACLRCKEKGKFPCSIDRDQPA